MRENNRITYGHSKDGAFLGKIIGKGEIRQVRQSYTKAPHSQSDGQNHRHGYSPRRGGREQGFRAPPGDSGRMHEMAMW